MAAVTRAMAGDGDAAIEAVAQVGERYGDRGVLVLCRHVAQLLKDFACTDGEGPLSPDDVPGLAQMMGDGPDVWASRFAVAYARGEQERVGELWAAHEGDYPVRVRAVFALVRLAATVMEELRERVRG